MRSLKNIATALTLSAAFAAAAQAQATCGATTTSGSSTCTLSGTSVTGTLGKIVYVSLTNPAYGLTMPTDLDFTAAGTVNKVDAAAQVATIRANANWTLTIKGAAWTGTGNNSKTVGDIAWTTNGGGSYTALTTGNVTLSSGSPTQAATATIGYRTTWALDSDSPGTYSMALTFIMTAP